MLKRKYGNRSGWSRVLQRKYAQSFLDTREFKGYITLLHIKQVTEPLIVDYGDENICIAEKGYLWLQQFPMDKNHSVTTMFNTNGDVVQWYIDICLCNGIDNNNPWMDNLFIDIVVLPSGELFEKDADELEEALLEGIIEKEHYDLARNEASKLKRLISQGKFELMQLSTPHKELLLNKLK
jgi:uncharacterized protein